MPYSKQTFAYTTGARTFTLALASGYDNESNISVYVVGEVTGGGDQIFRTFTFDSEFVINVTDALDNPSSVVVQRTVSPTVFSVDFEAGADVTKRNLQLAFRQQFFLMQEILDGRVDGVDIDQRAEDAETAATSAVAADTSASASATAAAASASSIDLDELINRSGTVDFTAKQIGVAPTADLHLATKKYVDDVVGGGGAMLLDGSAQMAAAMLLVNAAPTLGNHATRKTYVDAADALKANLASPTFTGNPIAPTQSGGNDSTRIATTAFVATEIASGGAGAFSGALLHIRDEKSEGTDGGTFTSGAWRKRDLNTVLTNEISGASLSSSQITLPAGTYYISAEAPYYKTDPANHKIKLWNSTNSVDILVGTSMKGGSALDATTRSKLYGRFTISSEKVIELQHRTSSTSNNTGFGGASTLGAVEVYTVVQIWKVA